MRLRVLLNTTARYQATLGARTDGAVAARLLREGPLIGRGGIENGRRLYIRASCIDVDDDDGGGDDNFDDGDDADDDGDGALADDGGHDADRED